MLSTLLKLQSRVLSQGFPTNPRTFSTQHMRENLSAYDFTLSEAEIGELSSRPQVLLRRIFE